MGNPILSCLLFRFLARGGALRAFCLALGAFKPAGNVFRWAGKPARLNAFAVKPLSLIHI